MTNAVTNILQKVNAGDPAAGAELLPLVYDELRKLATRQMAKEQPGQTLNATALVHEAYLRLVGSSEGNQQQWDCRAHFFGAAAQAMRRILVENARRKARIKHGGELKRVSINEADPAIVPADDEILALDEALEKLAAPSFGAGPTSAPTPSPRPPNTPRAPSTSPEAARASGAPSRT